VVATHSLNYGEEWMPMWEYETTLERCLKETPAFLDDRPCPPLPWQIRCGLPLAQLIRKAKRRLGTFASRRLRHATPPAAGGEARPEGSGAQIPDEEICEAFHEGLR
jgi:hypothetical protein